MILRKDRSVEDRLEKVEKRLAELTAEAHAARANFLMTKNTIDKLKVWAETHVHTMVDDHGKGTSRAQHEVINVIHEMVQVLEVEANTMKVDQNGMIDAMSGISQRLAAQEDALRQLCARLSSAVIHPDLFKGAK